ncbi:MAG: 23S rRNA (uracil(1939)-C(5))-methyltransferase RlmD [Coriobacteriia bacterium]|nr:23S rRNA (uracil(1939)-C(5))-methyltransferase RlmD [Coriobacteriia bacterium]
MRLEILSMAYGGDGVARLEDGRTAFVSATCPGDVVEADIVSDHGSFVRARITGLQEPSPDRVEPPCPYFGTCGGCQWQHIDATVQRAAKTAAVADALQRIGRIPRVAVSECSAASESYGYRNKAEFLTTSKRGALELGFAEAASSNLVDIDDCLLLPKRARAIPRALRGALKYVSGSQDLGIRRVSLRVATHTRGLQIALWTTPGPFPRKAAAKTLADATGADSVVRVLFKGEEAARQVVQVEVLGGLPWWSERLRGTRHVVSAPSFFQVNTTAAEELVSRVVATAGLRPSDRVFDVYAGVGTFTVPLAREAGDVIAIESSRYALSDLRRNLDDSDTAAEVLPGDAAIVVAQAGSADVVLVDPPRAGLEGRTLEAIASASPSRLVYVSCDPTTLARDAASLSGDGYELESVQPLDLFPQTYHVECVALFRRD